MRNIVNVQSLSLLLVLYFVSFPSFCAALTLISALAGRDTGAGVMPSNFVKLCLVSGTGISNNQFSIPKNVPR